MSHRTSQLTSFHVTDWLPDGDRILIIAAADATASRSFSSIHHLCLYKSQQFFSFPRCIGFDPANVPPEFRPTCEDALDEHLSQAKAQIDAAYSAKTPNLAQLFGLPSKKVRPVSTSLLAQFYINSSFNKPIESIYGATEFSGLSDALRKIVDLPVIVERERGIPNFRIP